MPSSPSIDEIRLQVSGQLDPHTRAALGQFMTPTAVANFMVSMVRHWPQEARLLDPGAGIGSLTEAFASEFFLQTERDSRLHVTAYEIDSVLAQHMNDRLRTLAERSPSECSFTSTPIHRDLIREAVFEITMGGPRYTHVILNPPYKKLASTSEYRRLLRDVGVETSNLYSAFLALAVLRATDYGEIVAIVPRSFCNGVYFRPFREWLLERVAITHIHVFDSRRRAFSDDDVLQENIIMRMERGGTQGTVTVSSSHDPSLNDYREHTVPFESIVKTSDPQSFIHIPLVEVNGSAALFSVSLKELGLSVSTGPVVDFRLRDHCHPMPIEGGVPLLYAHHFKGGELQWPIKHKKPNAIDLNETTSKWLMPRGHYTITKRFSSKEERRRVVAYVVEAEKIPTEFVGFENHLNVIHAGKRGISPHLAKGLALFLNCTVVDDHFRSFSGHTQVNATDLRSMLFPKRDTLIRMGKWASTRGKLSQEQIDDYVDSINVD